MTFNVEVKVVVYSLDIHDYAYSTDLTFPPGLWARWAPIQPAAVDPALDLCSRYPFRLGGPSQRGICLPDISKHNQCWESNPKPSNLASNVLSTCNVPNVQSAVCKVFIHLLSVFGLNKPTH